MSHTLRTLRFAVLVSASVAAAAYAQTSPTVRVPLCLLHPDTNTLAPCTGVVPIDRDTGNALRWQDVMTGGSGGGSSSVGTAGQTAGSTANQTGYVGSDGRLYSWTGDTAGHPAVSIFGTPSVTLSGTPSVTVTNFPASQTVSVSNFPATQPISGTVTANIGTTNGLALDSSLSTLNTTTNGLFKAGQSIGNTGFGITGTLPAFAATPTVNLGTLNGAATSAKQDNLLTALGSPFQAGGSVGNSYFGARLQDASGSAFGTSANPVYTTGTATPTGTAGSPNSNVVSVQGVSGGTALPVNQADMTAITTTTGSSLNAVLFQADMTNYPGGIDFQLNFTTSPTMTVTYQVSNDGTNWNTAAVNGINTASSVTATAVTGTASLISFRYTGGMRYFRAYISAYTAGSVATVAYLRAMPRTIDYVGISTAVGVNGTVASGSTDAGSPVKTGGYASGTQPTAVTTGQRINAWYSLNGATVMATSPTALSADAGNAPGDVVDAAGTTRPLATGATVYNGATWDRQRGDTTGTYTVPTPTSSANNAITPLTVTNVTSHVAKATAGNLYGINVDNAAVSGTYVIDYNASAAPAAGAALTTGLILWHYLLPSGGTLDKVFNMPVYAANGHVILYSTSLTSFTAPGTNPTLSTVMVK